ncbi:unnamed protein product [Schistosoma curassoni]|uniref:Ovule protein n=1 Tax=Schistosoma curassoni TaxID=6186 RepID=A0A183K895_9TREM|nr:unnamed protein product [Schistosoma curassoni]
MILLECSLKLLGLTRLPKSTDAVSFCPLRYLDVYSTLNFSRCEFRNTFPYSISTFKIVNSDSLFILL